MNVNECLIPSKYIVRAAHEIEYLNRLVDKFGLDEVVLGFKLLSEDLKTQLETRTDSAEWRQRVGELYARVCRVTSTLKARLKVYNREQSASAVAIEKRWSKMALELARVVDEIAPERLDEIDGPSDELTAGEWLDKREEILAAKTLKRNKED